MFDTNWEIWSRLEGFHKRENLKKYAFRSAVIFNPMNATINTNFNGLRTKYLVAANVMREQTTTNEFEGTDQLIYHIFSQCVSKLERRRLIYKVGGFEWIFINLLRFKKRSILTPDIRKQPKPPLNPFKRPI